MLETIQDNYFTITGSPKMVINSSGDLVVSPVNELSYDHHPLTLQCRGILLEPAAINYWPDNTNFSIDVAKANTLPGDPFIGLNSVKLTGVNSSITGVLPNFIAMARRVVVSMYVKMGVPPIGGELSDPNKDFTVILNGYEGNIPAKYKVVHHLNDVYRVYYVFNLPYSMVGDQCVITTGSANRGNEIEIVGVQVEDYRLTSLIMTNGVHANRNVDRVVVPYPAKFNDDQNSIVIKYNALESIGCACQLNFSNPLRRLFISRMNTGQYPLISDNFDALQKNYFKQHKKTSEVRVAFSGSQIRISYDQEPVQQVNRTDDLTKPTNIVLGDTEAGQFFGYIEKLDFHIRALMETELMYGIPFYDSAILGGSDDVS